MQPMSIDWGVMTLSKEAAEKAKKEFDKELDQAVEEIIKRWKKLNGGHK